MKTLIQYAEFDLRALKEATTRGIFQAGFQVLCTNAVKGIKQWLNSTTGMQ